MTAARGFVNHDETLHRRAGTGRKAATGRNMSESGAKALTFLASRPTVPPMSKRFESPP